MPPMKLDQWLSEQNISNQAFAALIGVDQASVWRLRQGVSHPDWKKTLPKIVDATGGAVTANDFMVDSEERFGAA